MYKVAPFRNHEWYNNTRMIYNLPSQVTRIFKAFQKAGFEIYAVGGSVRDLILGRPTKNWDFTTNAQPEQIQELFPDSYYDNQFGTVGLKLENEEIYEVTTFRTEKDYSDKRHPDTVLWGKSLAEDLARRDFTIGAIALHFVQGKPTFIDPFKGQEDLKTKTVRTVGEPKIRFSEDALRLLRAIRIATELEFTIEPKTFAAIKENAALINRISSERIHDELFKILKSKFPYEGLMLLKNAGLLKEILPELEISFETPQVSPGRHHLYDVGTHSFLSLKFCPSTDPVTRLATLLHDIGKPLVFQKDELTGLITFYNHEILSTKLARKISERLKMSKKDSLKLLTLIRWHQFSVDEHQTDSALRRFIRRVGRENLEEMLALRIGDHLGGGARETSWRLEEFKKRLISVQQQPFTVADLKVDGHDVMEILNLKPGPKVGEILNELFEEVIKNPEKNEREYLLKRIEEINK